jgi:hypothetical protein
MGAASLRSHMLRRNWQHSNGKGLAAAGGQPGVARTATAAQVVLRTDARKK